MAGRIGGIYKDKSKTIAYGLKHGRSTIYLDDDGKWRSSFNILNTPYDCKAWQVVPGLEAAHQDIMKHYRPVQPDDQWRALLAKEIKG